MVKLRLERGFGDDTAWPLLPLDQVRAITDEAHRHGTLVTAHATSSDEVQLALDGGVDNLAHTPTEPLADALVQLMVKTRSQSPVPSPSSPPPPPWPTWRGSPIWGASWRWEPISGAVASLPAPRRSSRS